MGDAQQVTNGQANGGFGQVRQCAGHGFQWPDSTYIRYRGNQRGRPLGLPQRGGYLGALRGGGNMAQGGQALHQRRIGSLCRHQDNGRGFAQSQFSEVGTIAA